MPQAWPHRFIPHSRGYVSFSGCKLFNTPDGKCFAPAPVRPRVERHELYGQAVVESSRVGLRCKGRSNVHYHTALAAHF